MIRLFAAFFLAAWCASVLAAGGAPHVDIPVKLEKEDVVFNMDHLAFAGDMPVGIDYMHLQAERMKANGTKGRIIAIFHGDGAYMTLNDAAYNAHRGVTTGNPYKGLIRQLQERGCRSRNASTP